MVLKTPVRLIASNAENLSDSSTSLTNRANRRNLEKPKRKKKKKEAFNIIRYRWRRSYMRNQALGSHGVRQGARFINFSLSSRERTPGRTQRKQVVRISCKSLLFCLTPVRIVVFGRLAACCSRGSEEFATKPGMSRRTATDSRSHHLRKAAHINPWYSECYSSKVVILNILSGQPAGSLKLESSGTALSTMVCTDGRYVASPHAMF